MPGGAGLYRTAEGSYSCRAAAEPSGKARGGDTHRPGDTAADAMDESRDDETAPRNKGLAAGALLVAKHDAQAVRELLHELRWLKKGKNVTTPTPQQLGAAGVVMERGRLLALHLNHAGASMVPELEAVGGTEAAALRELEEAGRLRFAPGLRVGMTQNPRLKPWTAAEERPDGKPPRFTLIELFAGIGGFRIGLGAIGGRSVFASEIDAEAQDIYCQNFGSGLLAGDITDVDLDDIPPHDMLTAGFCCQPFSKAGKQEGFEDPRGQLFYEITRVLRHRRPASFLLENVANLLLHRGGRTLKEIVAELEDAGYLVTYRVMNSSTLLPQHRQRVYFAGFRNDLHRQYESFRWPEMPLLGRMVGEILEPEGPRMEHHRLSERQWEKICSNPDFRGDPGRRAAMRHGPARTLMASYKASFYMHSEFVFPAHEPLNEVPTEAPRFYTPRECARIQGFPEDFVLEGSNKNRVYHGVYHRIYHCLGNAVSPPVVAAIGGCILCALEIDQGDQKTSAGPEPLNERQALVPALQLVEACCPAVDSSGPEQLMAVNGRQEAGGLSQRMHAFLQQGSAGCPAAAGTTAVQGEAVLVPAAVPVHLGYTDDIGRCGGPGPLAALLESPELRPQMAALRDICYMSHTPPVAQELARANRAAMAAHPGFLCRIVEIAVLCEESALEQEGGEKDGSGAAMRSAGANDAAALAIQQQHRDRGVAAEVQRLAVMSLAHLGAYQDSAALLPAEASAVLRRIAENDSNSANLRRIATLAVAAISDNSASDCNTVTR